MTLFTGVNDTFKINTGEYCTQFLFPKVLKKEPETFSVPSLSNERIFRGNRSHESGV